MSTVLGSLRRVVEKFQGTRIAVVGDLFLDHYIWGRVDRISPEAPVVVVNVTSEDRRLGGAGNVARNLIRLGAQVSMCGVVGDDEPGRLLIGMLEELGADTDAVMVDRTRSSIVKTRVIAHSQQVVRIDHEILKPLNLSYAQGIATALESKFSKIKGIVVSDYGKRTICAEVFEPIQRGLKEGLLGAGKVPVLIDPKSPNFALYSGATIIKPNRSEASEASGISIVDRATAAEAGRLLKDRWNSDMVLITLGEQGMVLVDESSTEAPTIEVDTVAQDVFDVSGAGDTVSAVFLLALASGADARQAAILSNCAAGIVVAEVGTVAVTREELLARLETVVKG
jgi:D-beta-D-heptose 7-phosphate kinase/D-beta-D-heptose 1-phosphate adenosyltransferase